MADALPPNVKTKLHATGHAGNLNHWSEIKSNIASSNNIVRHSAARMVDEGSPANARAVDKILSLPK